MVSSKIIVIKIIKKSENNDNAISAVTTDGNIIEYFKIISLLKIIKSIPDVVILPSEHYS